MAVMPKLAGFGQTLLNGFNRLSDGPSMPGLMPDENQAATERHRMAMLAQILQATQPSRTPQSGLAAIGQGIMAGQQAKDQYGADAMRAKLYQAQIGQIENPSAQRLVGVANPSDFEPESLAEYQRTGNPAVLKPRANIYGRYNPGDYTPDSWARFQSGGDPSVLERFVKPQIVGTAGGGQVAVNPLDPTNPTTVISDNDATSAAADKARATSEASAIGDATGKALGAYMSKAATAQGVNEILDIAEPIIDVATGSGTGAARDKVAAWFGISTEGAQGIAQLVPLQAALMMSMPRMEGPQSNLDVQLYREAAGQIGDASVPGETKKAAMRTIRSLHEKYGQRGYVPGQTPIIPNSAQPQPQPPQSEPEQAAPQVAEGTVIRNPQTGETMVLRGNQWVKQ